MAFTRLSHHLHNILEDGYIEETMLRRFPGVLGANLNIMRESIWADTKTVALLIEQEEDERMKWRSILQIMLSYFRTVRIGSSIRVSKQSFDEWLDRETN